MTPENTPRRTRWHRWLLGTALALIAGCSIAPLVIHDVEKLSAPGSDFPGQATVYVFRGGSVERWELGVSVDDAAVGTLPWRSYVKFPVSPGRRVVASTWPMFTAENPGVSIKAKFQPDRTYYFLYEAFRGANVAEGIHRSEMRQVEPESGAALVERYQLVETAGL